MSTYVSIKHVHFKGEDRILFYAPYNKSWPAQAHRLGGTWDTYGKFWAFPAEKEEQVRAAARHIYGTDGSDLVWAWMSLHLYAKMDEAWAFGRRVAWRLAWNTRIQLGDGVEVISGGYYKDWGSPQNAVFGPNNLVLQISVTLQEVQAAMALDLDTFRLGRVHQLPVEPIERSDFTKQPPEQSAE